MSRNVITNYFQKKQSLANKSKMMNKDDEGLEWGDDCDELMNSIQDDLSRVDDKEDDDKLEWGENIDDEMNRIQNKMNEEQVKDELEWQGADDDELTDIHDKMMMKKDDDDRWQDVNNDEISDIMDRMINKKHDDDEKRMMRMRRREAGRVECDCVVKYEGDNSTLCREVQQVLGELGGPEASTAKLGKALPSISQAPAVTDVHTDAAPTMCVHGRQLPGAHTESAFLDNQVEANKMYEVVPSCASQEGGHMNDVTTKLQKLQVTDKCVYETVRDRQHRHRAGMRCVTHSCVLRRTWLRTTILAFTLDKKPIQRVGVRLGWGCAVVRKARPSPNLSTLFGSVQWGNTARATRFGLKRPRETSA